MGSGGGGCPGVPGGARRGTRGLIDCLDPLLLGCNDDFEGCPAYSSCLEVPVLSANQYLLRIGGWEEGNVGTGTLLIELVDRE